MVVLLQNPEVEEELWKLAAVEFLTIFMADQLEWSSATSARNAAPVVALPFASQPGSPKASRYTCVTARALHRLMKSVRL